MSHDQVTEDLRWLQEAAESPSGKWHLFQEPKPVAEDANGWMDISSAPKDGTLIDVWISYENRKDKDGYFKHKKMGYSTKARWVEDDRDERSAHRHELMMKHDGYWAQGRMSDGKKPLKGKPSHWTHLRPPPVCFCRED